MKEFLIAGASALILASCNVPGPSLAGYEGLQTKVMWYYRLHAVEENGICRAPEMRAITATRVVEDTDEQTVLELRYRYLDTTFRDPDRPALIGNCDGFNTRQFTIAKTDGHLEVKDMSGPANS